MTLSPANGYFRPQASKSSYLGPLNILVARQRGRLLSFQVSGALLLIAAVFSLLFIAAGLWGLNHSFKLNQYVWALEDHNQKLRHELKLKNVSLIKLKRDQAMLINLPPLSGLIPKDNPQAAPAGTAAGQLPPAAGEASALASPALPAEGSSDDQPAGLRHLSLEALIALLPEPDPETTPEIKLLSPLVSLKNGQLAISFTLQVQDPSGQAIQGRTWVWAELDIEGQRRLLSHPPADTASLRNIEYQRGDPFSIRNNKPVRVVFQPLPDEARIIKAMALVWSEDGRLWVKNALPLAGN